MTDPSDLARVVDVAIDCEPAGPHTKRAGLDVRVRPHGLYVRAATSGVNGGRREVALVVPPEQATTLRDALDRYVRPPNRGAISTLRAWTYALRAQPAGAVVGCDSVADTLDAVGDRIAGRGDPHPSAPQRCGEFTTGVATEAVPGPLLVCERPRGHTPPHRDPSGAEWVVGPAAPAPAGQVEVARAALAAYYRHGLGNDAVDEEHDARELLAALGLTAGGGR